MCNVYARIQRINMVQGKCLCVRSACARIYMGIHRHHQRAHCVACVSVNLWFSRCFLECVLFTLLRRLRKMRSMYYSIDPFLNARGCCRVLFLFPPLVRWIVVRISSTLCGVRCVEFKELSWAQRITCATNKRHTRVNLYVALLRLLVHRVKWQWNWM